MIINIENKITKSKRLELMKVGIISASPVVSSKGSIPKKSSEDEPKSEVSTIGADRLSRL